MLSTIIKYLYLVALIAPMSILAMPITIIAPSKTFTLDVEPSDSIGTLRQLISDETSIPYDRVVITQSVEGGTAVLDDNYVSLSDRNIKKNDELTVIKKNTAPSFSFSEWKDLGSASFVQSNFAKSYVKIRVDTNDVPWVILRGGPTGSSVMKFNGTDWEFIGDEMDSSDSYFASLYPDLIFDSNNTPFISFGDIVDSDKILRVRTFNGTSWKDVGSPVTNGDVSYINLAFDHNGVLHVVYIDSSLGNKAVVKKYDGNNWVSVGFTRFYPI
ncbi:hypothetical protein [Pseudoalteromonas sp. GB43]